MNSDDLRTLRNADRKSIQQRVAMVDAENLLNFSKPCLCGVKRTVRSAGFELRDRSFQAAAGERPATGVLKRLSKIEQVSACVYPVVQTSMQVVSPREESNADYVVAT